MQEICINCDINESCLNKSPINIRGFAPDNWHNCVRYSGNRLRDQAVVKQRQKLEAIETEDGIVRGWRFGTVEQPTDKDNEIINRFVDIEGYVYLLDKSGDKVWQKTGQRFWKK